MRPIRCSRRRRSRGGFNFIGNVEANDVMLGKADVVVTDGYTGNIMLKGLEGTAKFLLKELKASFLSSTRGKLAAGMVKGDLEQMKNCWIPLRWAVRPSWASPSRSSRPTAGPMPGPSPMPCSGRRNMPRAALSPTLPQISTICAFRGKCKNFLPLLTPVRVLPYDYPSEYIPTSRKE